MRDRTPISRRDMLRRCSNGFGMLAASSLLSEDLLAQGRRPDFPAKAKNVIFCYMSGGVGADERRYRLSGDHPGGSGW